MSQRILSDIHFVSYNDFKAFNALNSKKLGNANISSALAASKLSLVSFDSASKIVYIQKCMSSKNPLEQNFKNYSQLKVILAVGRA